MLELPPDHLVDDADVGLDDADDLRGNVFVHVVRDRDARIAVLDQFHSHINGLQQTLGINTTEDKAALVQRFRALGGGADADSREWMADGGEKGGFFGQGTGI